MALAYLRLFTTPERSVGQEEVARELEDAVPVFEELGDEAGLARALAIAGTLRFWQGEAEAATEDLERAARHARHVDDRAQEAQSLQYVLMAELWGPTPVEDALGRLDEIRSRAKANRRLEVDLLGTRALLEAMQGRFGPARDLIAQAKALAEELGLEVLRAGSVAYEAGYVELLAHDAAGAERELRPACEALERMGDWGQLATVAPMLVDDLLVQGREEEAQRLTERWTAERLTVPEDADAEIAWRRVRAKLLARGGGQGGRAPRPRGDGARRAE